ncbi:hypothetical protein [Natronorubrum sulfidifaciens]|uniref:Uncharacterized protein n=1 Tax=Natronorubrum sulfidifaciens JCM 14089 TaxID=1230460 RepID=L9WFJ2_9EURY|nr:hypothetical protein [Natronorubrum sulfidifaciens]ELY48132.1 hypothetical protein C495_01620 [Natronorubrum sulfidifaciens JCM 14089]
MIVASIARLHAVVTRATQPSLRPASDRCHIGRDGSESHDREWDRSTTASVEIAAETPLRA